MRLRIAISAGFCIAVVLHVPLSASGFNPKAFTGLGVGAEYDYGSSGNLSPTVSLTQGSVGILSYFGSIDVGYRTADPGFMARASVEAYFLYFGLFGGVQSNTSPDRPADYGFPLGLAFMIPKANHIFRFKVGSILYTDAHAHELMVSGSIFWRVW